MGLLGFFIPKVVSQSEMFWTENTAYNLRKDIDQSFRFSSFTVIDSL